MKLKKQFYFVPVLKPVNRKKQPFLKFSNEEKLKIIADAGYETAEDILFPETGKIKKSRLLLG